ncbi:WD40-repeat-containing domain protein [Chytridium lagenaria]|nr:WD40-repeat-containing domain protein [Chytridium lagenaria]
MSDAFDAFTIILTLLLGTTLAGIIFLFLFRRTASLAVSVTNLPPPPPPTTPAESDAETLPAPAPKPVPRKAVKTGGAAKQNHAPRPNHGRFVCQLRGHLRNVTGISFGNGVLASAGADRTIRVWHVSSFERKESNFIPKVTKIDHESDSPTGIAITADASTIVVATNNNLSVRIYTVHYSQTFLLVNILANPTARSRLALMGVTKGYCFSCSSDTTLNFWRTSGAERIDCVKTNTVNNYVARMSPRWAVGCAGRIFVIFARWDPIAFSISGHSRGIVALSFGSKDRILTVSKDGTAKLWNLNVRYEQREDPKLLTTLNIAKDLNIPDVSHVSHVALSPDITTAAFAHGRSITLWSFRDAKILDAITEAHPGNVSGVEWSLDGKFFATFANDGKDVHVWEG